MFIKPSFFNSLMVSEKIMAVLLIVAIVLAVVSITLTVTSADKEISTQNNLNSVPGDMTGNVAISVLPQAVGPSTQ